MALLSLLACSRAAGGAAGRPERAQQGRNLASHIISLIESEREKAE
ncbi:hypothetical protein [Pseudarthrobacter sp. PvP090]